ncbi:MAG: hypothetical protein R3300_15575 [Candidatus Promineifilaceae bacterium]|nr:hypothetical protein [Candidatus Promineifilaceae bacterium]
MTLIGLLVVPALGALLTRWATFLAAVALLLGAANLVRVHGQRLADGNVYSAVLLLGLVGMLVLGATDAFGLTEGWVGRAFDLVLFPLEAALASLLALFLLFSAMGLLRRQRSGWTLLFLFVVVLLLLARSPMPEAMGEWLVLIDEWISALLVSAGVRAILIGIALGTITISLRLLMGYERPYER